MLHPDWQGDGNPWPTHRAGRIQREEADHTSSALGVWLVVLAMGIGAGIDETVRLTIWAVHIFGGH